jgi:hypothetical protein
MRDGRCEIKKKLEEPKERCNVLWYVVCGMWLVAGELETMGDVA